MLRNGTGWGGHPPHGVGLGGLAWGLATPDTRLKGALGAGAAPKPCPVAQHKFLLL